MSRSVHTRPLEFRADSRARSPYASRGEGDARLERAERRRLKALGMARLVPGDAPLVPADARLERAEVRRLPRVVVRAPLPGHVHGATKVEVEELLRALGPEVHYGLRSIELGGPSPARGLVLGRFEAPGRIRVFGVPRPPWRLAAQAPETGQLLAAGARLARGERGELLLEWPGSTLRDFVLRHVLLHEIGHHLLQHHAGKRLVPIARTRDHEAFAERFARRARERLATLDSGAA